ncbi:MAG: DUF835 domain-containing protein, partial [Thermoplasmata archaeon]
LVKEKKPVLSFRMFIEMMLQEKDGLCISRQHPSTLEKKLEKFNVERFWLTGIEGKDNIDPTNLGIISDSIIRYIKKHRNSVVILDGFELLVSHNDFSQVLRMVDHVIEQMMQHGAVLIMPIDERTLENKELALLERSMEVIEG